MSRRHWYNDLARDIRDINTLQRTFGRGRQLSRGCSTAVWVVLLLLVFAVIWFAVWVGQASKRQKNLEPEQVTATFEAQVRNNLMPAGVTYVPTVTAVPAEDDAPTATPIPTPTIDPALLIRYEEIRTDAQGREYVQCLIKGNINSKGVKIYHLPGSSAYNSTKIDTDQGERWFCTEAEAIAAGWHAPGQ